MFPRAGGQYHFLKEAYGPLLGLPLRLDVLPRDHERRHRHPGRGLRRVPRLLPALLLDRHTCCSRCRSGAGRWAVNGGQLAGALAIVVPDRRSTTSACARARVVQNAVTVVKIGSIVALAVLGPAGARRRSRADFAAAACRQAACWRAFGVAMIAVLWSYDGWYGFTFLAGEMRRPGAQPAARPASRAPLAVTVALRAHQPRLLARAAGGGDGGDGPHRRGRGRRCCSAPPGARLVSLAVVVSTFGCISATILYAARIYLPMAAGRRSSSAPWPASTRATARPPACLAGPGRLGDGAHLLRHLRAALHLRRLRALPLPRRSPAPR